MLRESLEIPAAWKRADVEGQSDWIHELSADEIRDLDGALASAKATGKGLAGAVDFLTSPRWGEVGRRPGAGETSR